MTLEEIKKQKEIATDNNEPLWEIAYQLAELNYRVAVLLEQKLHPAIRPMDRTLLEPMSRTLLEAFEGPKTITHPGGAQHYDTQDGRQHCPFCAEKAQR